MSFAFTPSGGLNDVNQFPDTDPLIRQHLQTLLQQLPDNFDPRINGVTNTAILSATGYHKDTKTGIIFQWGNVTLPANTGSNAYSFPITFPVSCAVTVASIWDSSNSSGSSACRVINFSTTQVTIANSLALSMKATYIAVGY